MTGPFPPPAPPESDRAAAGPGLSVIIPAFQEAHRLPANLPRVAAYLDALLPAGGYEVLVIVERSADGTLERCREAAANLGPGFRIVDNGPQRGKGHAVRSGMRRARGAVQLFTDADLSTPLEEIGRFLEHLGNHPEIDVLIGDRRQDPALLGRPQGFWRRRLGAVYSRAARRCAGEGLPAGLADTQCGFKAFRRPAAQAIFARQQLDGFAFDIEVLMLAVRLNLRLAALPIRGWRNVPLSTLRVARDGWRMLRDLARVRGLVERSLASRAEGPPAV